LYVVYLLAFVFDFDVQVRVNNQTATDNGQRTTDKFMNLKQKIVNDLTAAMKAKDVVKTSVLRMVKSAITNKEIEKGSKDTALTDDELMKLLQTLLKQRRDSIEQFERGGRTELAEKEKAEVVVIEGYLPQAASREEIEAAVAKAITETGASSMKEMGAVMKAAQAKLAGKNADGKTVSEIVKAKLS
jgi:hypothetical protein